MLDFRAGLIACIIANANRNPKKQPKAFTPQDFMPKRERKKERKKLTPDELLAQLRVMNAALGGKEKING